MKGLANGYATWIHVHTVFYFRIRIGERRMADRLKLKRHGSLLSDSHQKIKIKLPLFTPGK